MLAHLAYGNDVVQRVGRFSVLLLLFVLALLPGIIRSASADTIFGGAISVGDLHKMQVGETKASLASAIKAFESNDLASCKEELDAARSINADLPHVDVILSRMYLSRGDVRRALTLLESHVVDHPGDPDAFQSFGEIALGTGRLTDAWLQLAHAESCAKTADMSDVKRAFLASQLTRLRAITAEKRRDYKSALRLYRELLADSPDERQLMWKLGQMLVAAGETDSGCDLLDKANQKLPTLPQTELTVATILASTDSDDAERWYKKGLRAETATQQNLLEYVRWLLVQGRLDYVSKVLDATPAKWKSDRDVIFISAVVDRCLGEMESAEARLRAILGDNPNDLEASDQLALLLIESNDQAKRLQAKQLSQSNLQRTPKLQRSIATAAWIELQLGAIDVAERMFKALHQSGSISPQTAFYIAKLMDSRDQNQEAETFYRRALDSNAFFPQRREIRAKLAEKTTQ